MSDAAVGPIDAPRRRAPRWMWIALIASLAVNLAVAGIIGGTAWRWRHGGPPGSSLMIAGERFLRTLPPERRQSLKDIIFRHRDFRWRNWRELRRARNELASAMRTEPFDRGRVEHAVGDLQRLELAVREDFLPVFGEVAEALTPDERERFIGELRWRRNGP